MSELSRLPPNQQLLAAPKWPIIGERESQAPVGPWQVSVSGLGEKPVSFSVQQLAEFEQTLVDLDIHCVTRWSRFDMQFSGVLLETVLKAVGGSFKDAQFVSFVAYSERNHSTSLPLDQALEQKVLLALTANGEPLPDSHGGPVRIITPGRYFYKSLKWLKEIRILAQDELGYWEKDNGYHNHADPWLEERYVISDIDINRYRELIKKRDFSGQTILSIDAGGRNLAGLNAKGAALRNGCFEKTQLAGSDFSQANLSNASFKNADLVNAQFIGADLEGANFSGADLTGANLADSSLFGATFFDGPIKAQLNHTTLFSLNGLDALTPEQKAFVLQSING